MTTSAATSSSQRERSMPLDTVAQVETPEGVDLELHPAGFVPRAAAWLLDLALRFGIGLIVVIVFSALGQFGSGLILLTIFGLESLYPLLFEALNSGRTPGKTAVGLQVLRYDGTPLDWGAATLRNLLRTADFLPFLYGFGLTAMLIDGRFRRLGDIAAGTVVVHMPSGARQALPGDIAPLPPPVLLELAEQQALISLAQRRPKLSEARAEELATIVRQALWPHGTPSPSATLKRLLAIAAWSLGRRRTAGRAPNRRGERRQDA